MIRRKDKTKNVLLTLRYIEAGFPTKVIAVRLGVTPRTVQRYRALISECQIPVSLFAFENDGFKFNPDPKVVKGILTMLERNDGECPCHNIGKTLESRLCPCKEYRLNGNCCCTLYIKKTPKNGGQSK